MPSSMTKVTFEELKKQHILSTNRRGFNRLFLANCMWIGSKRQPRADVGRETITVHALYYKPSQKMGVCALPD